MRITIVGAGEVGFDVAQMLSNEGHDVVVIERDPERAQSVQEKLDVMAITGNGASTETLKAAEISRSDMLVAVTTVDEVNILACMLADRLGVPTTIARIRSDEYTAAQSVITAGEFGIDLVIHPEESTAEEAVRLIRRAGATDALSFAEDRLQLLGMRVEQGSRMVGQSLAEVGQQTVDLHFRIMALRRGGRTILPRGKERLMEGDQMFVLAPREDVPAVTRHLGQEEAGMKYIMILGGGLVGASMARHLSSDPDRVIKLIEPDPDLAQRLANNLPDVLVLNGDPTDIDLLATEGLAEMDAVAAVTADEESNLVASLIAKHLGVRKTLALLSKRGYIPISQMIGLDAAVNVKLAVSHEVSRFLRGKHVLSVASIHGVDAEILELRADEGARITKGTLMEINVPNGSLIGAVISHDHVEIATGSTQLSAGDSAIVFVLPHVTKKLERLFNGH